MEFLELLKVIQESIPPDYAWVSRAISDIFPWLVLGMALLLCFFGHKVHQLWAEFLFGGIGVLAGVVTGAFLLMAFPALNTWVALTPPFILGVLGVIFAKRLHKLQLFFVNAALVYAALPGVLSRWLPDEAALLVGLIAAIAVGLLAAKYKYIVTIITTSVSGALTAVPMVLEIIGVNSFPLLLALEGLLIAAGLTVQFLTERRAKIREKAKEALKEKTAAE